MAVWSKTALNGSSDMGVAVFFGASVLVNEPLEEHELPSRRVRVDQGIIEAVAGLLTDAAVGQQNLQVLQAPSV